MKTVRWFGVFALAALCVATTQAQDLPKPGPEHEILKKMVGTWDVTMKMAGTESKGVSVYKMDLGGLWLASTFEGDLGGMKFSGRGYDSYDAAKKKYIGVWMDSMNAGPLVMEGTYDSAKKSLTMTGEGPGPDGKPMKYKTVSDMTDANRMLFSMYMGDTKEPSFTMVYQRRK